MQIHAVLRPSMSTMRGAGARDGLVEEVHGDRGRGREHGRDAPRRRLARDGGERGERRRAAAQPQHDRVDEE